MKVTSKEEMGLRCMMRLAERSRGDRTVTISDLAKAEGLTPGYVGKIISQLRHGGLVKSIRGAGGSIELTQAPKDISLADIIIVLSGDDSGNTRVPIVEAGRMKNCNRYPNCNLKAVWGAMAAILQDTLSKVSLHDLVWGNPDTILKVIGGNMGTQTNVLTATIRKNKKESK